MRAEALFRQGNTTDAATDINVVRRRAYGDTSGDIDASDVTAVYLFWMRESS